MKLNLTHVSTFKDKINSKKHILLLSLEKNAHILGYQKLSPYKKGGQTFSCSFWQGCHLISIRLKRNAPWMSHQEPFIRFSTGIKAVKGFPLLKDSMSCIIIILNLQMRKLRLRTGCSSWVRFYSQCFSFSIGLPQ